MHSRHRSKARRNPVVDLTLSDNEIEGAEPEALPQLDIPEPTQPSKPRRLTARECLRADRIAFGEIDPPPLPALFSLESSSRSSQETLDLIDETSPDNDSVQPGRAGPSRQHHEPCTTARNDPSVALQRDNEVHKTQPLQTDTSPGVICDASEAEDTSDDEFVLYGEESIIDLTALKNEPEVVEMMANGQPRRACAPKFEELLRSGNRKLVKRALEIHNVRLTREERASADKHRADLIERGVAAHHALWENRLVHKFSHNCGRVDLGRARGALVEMGRFFGARPTVVKKKESGFVIRYVVMEAGERLCSPQNVDIREVADKLIDRAFKKVVRQKKKKKKKKKKKEKQKPGNVIVTRSKRETKQKREEMKRENKKGKGNQKIVRGKQSSERMREVAQGVRRDEEAFNQVVPIQVEIQRNDVKQEGVLTMTEESRGRKTLQIPRLTTTNHSKDRKRKLDIQEGTQHGNENRRRAWERKRQRKLEGAKIENGNKGFAMLAKMGWSEGQGLGAKRNGISEPIVAEFRSGRRGLGTSTSTKQTGSNTIQYQF